MQAAGVSGIPHSFVVDSEGVIQFSGHPGNPSFAAAVRKVCVSAQMNLSHTTHQWTETFSVTRPGV